MEGQIVSKTLISLPALISLALGDFHIVSSAIYAWKYLSLPCDILEDGWRHSGTESRAGAVALAFGAHSPTSRLQSKCLKPVVCAKFCPGFYLVWPIQVLISFNYLKAFKNLENLSKHLTFWLVLKILASFNTLLPGNNWLEMRAAVLWQDLRSPLCHNPYHPLLPHFTHSCSLFGLNPPIFLVSP